MGATEARSSLRGAGKTTEGSVWIATFARIKRAAQSVSRSQVAIVSCHTCESELTCLRDRSALGKRQREPVSNALVKKTFPTKTTAKKKIVRANQSFTPDDLDEVLIIFRLPCLGLLFFCQYFCTYMIPHFVNRTSTRPNTGRLSTLNGGGRSLCSGTAPLILWCCGMEKISTRDCAGPSLLTVLAS